MKNNKKQQITNLHICNILPTKTQYTILMNNNNLKKNDIELCLILKNIVTQFKKI